MRAAAHLATIQLLGELEPAIAALTSSDASTSQSRRAIQITSTPRRNPLFGMAMPVAAPMVASLVHGLRQMVARAGLTWKALKAVRYEIARISLVTIRKTGTTRESPWTRMTPNACSLTLLMS